MVHALGRVYVDVLSMRHRNIGLGRYLGIGGNFLHPTII